MLKGVVNEINSNSVDGMINLKIFLFVNYRINLTL